MLTRDEIARRRLHNQRLSGGGLAQPAEVVHWLAAVQAQDYAGARWGLGLRLDPRLAIGDAGIERAFNAGEILRTHVLRPTWHFVTPADIRWLLALTGPRVDAANAGMYRSQGLDAAVFKRSHRAIEKALRGGQTLTRDELRAVLEKAGVPTEGVNRMAYLMMKAELDGLICSGPRRGRQFTYALLEERAPPAKPRSRDEALAELAGRFFHSRGPATVHDLTRWSGLTVADARRGLEAVQAGLASEAFDGQTYWFPPDAPPPAVRGAPPTAYLLSIYDEYLSGYKDRSAIVSPEHGARLVALDNALTAVIVLDGQIVGTWKRTLSKAKVTVETDVYVRLSRAQQRALAAAAEAYGRFLGLAVEVT